MATTSDISKGGVIRFRDELFIVTEFQHVNPGKGSAFVRSKLRNIATGKTLEHTFKAGETIEIAEVRRQNMQYLYGDSDVYTFMDNETYEQVTLDRAMLEGNEGYLKEGLKVIMVMHEGSPVAIELPKKISFEVTETMDAVKGDTASGNVTKDAKIETGINVQVPLFIKQGEKIVINTDTGQYVERG